MPASSTCGHVGLAAVEARLVDEPLEHVHAAVETQVVRRAERPAHVRDQAAVVGEQREIGLRVAAVDREHDHASTSAVICSSSASAIRTGRSADGRAAPS